MRSNSIGIEPTNTISRYSRAFQVIFEMTIVISFVVNASKSVGVQIYTDSYGIT